MSARAITDQLATSAFPQAQTFMAFNEGGFSYGVWAGATTNGGEQGEVYVARGALDPCAQRNDHPTHVYVDPVRGGGVVSVTGHQGTVVSFTRAHGPAGSLDVRTETWT